MILRTGNSLVLKRDLPAVVPRVPDSNSDSVVTMCNIRKGGSEEGGGFGIEFIGCFWVIEFVERLGFEIRFDVGVEVNDEADSEDGMAFSCSKQNPNISRIARTVSLSLTEYRLSVDWSSLFAAGSSREEESLMCT